MKGTPFHILLQEARRSKGATLKSVSIVTGIDAALLSHIESGRRKATRRQVDALSEAYGIPQATLMIAYLGDRIYSEFGMEPHFLEALAVAENQVQYHAKKKGEEVSDALTRLLRQCDELRVEWSALHPLSELQLRNLQEYFDVAYTFESNRIEGNTLTLHETSLVVQKGLTIGGKSLREHLEAINHQHAIDFIRGVAGKREAISERLIKDIHALVLRGIDPDHAGRYRPLNVRISGSSHTPPEFFQVPAEMEALIRWYQKARKTSHPLVLAADMHQRLVNIHPFADGNGRTSRLLMNLMLMRAGFPTVIIRGSDQIRMAYYDALEKAHTEGTDSPFREFIAKEAIHSFTDLIHAVKGKPIQS
jgi:Fic family protein